MNRRLCMAGILAALSWDSVSAQSLDDSLAYELFQQGRFAEAAEVFTDTQWKGIAFYRSDQWWRAINAFARAADARSLYNLGNSYVRLGYLELALESYQTVQKMEPGNADAAHNARILLELLSREQSEGKGQRQSQQRELARVQTESSGTGETNQPEDPGDSPGDGGGGEAPQEEQGNKQPAGAGESGKQATDPETELGSDNPDSGDGDRSDTSTSPQAAPENGTPKQTEDTSGSGRRQKLEQEQSIEQWLNGIADDPGEWLARRLQAEIRQRRARGLLSEESPNRW